MTDNDVKLLFKSIKKLRTRRDILKGLKKMDNEYDQICEILHVLENSLEVLSEDEREVIQIHLVEGAAWKQVINQYEERHGRQNGYSKRTYERIQQKALQRIMEVLQNNEMEELLLQVSNIGI